jgi:hypothetical protein
MVPTQETEERFISLFNETITSTPVSVYLLMKNSRTIMIMNGGEKRPDCRKTSEHPSPFQSALGPAEFRKRYLHNPNKTLYRLTKFAGKMRFMKGC